MEMMEHFSNTMSPDDMNHSFLTFAADGSDASLAPTDANRLPVEFLANFLHPG
jgi:hypothetical protein